MPNDTFPQVTSKPIRVGGEIKSPYQWAAALAPDKELVAYKEALLWLEGDEFGSKEELIHKVKRVIEFQKKEKGGPQLPVPEVLEVEQDGDEAEEVVTVGKPVPVDDGFKKVGKKQRTKKPPAEPMGLTKLAEAIVAKSIEIMKRTFKFAGPSLNISEVDPKFDTKSFQSKAVIREIRSVILRTPSPHTLFPVAAKARYACATSPGKGNNFNFKVQLPSGAPGGWSAVAQIHVIWT